MPLSRISASRMPSLPESVGIKAFDRAGLVELFAQLGEPRFRADQLVRWLYQRGVASYADMTDLSASLRERLAEQYPLARPVVVDRQVSSDGTRKYLLRLADGVTVETVGLPSGDRLTVCFSTQAGCAMGCSFCATGASGFTRNLGPGEMVDQLLLVAGDFDRRVTNTVAMGQGEPFANYDATLGALRLINAETGMGVGARHITVSTCGLEAGIRRFATEPEQFTLAISLHSAVQSTRDRLMPGVRATPLPTLHAALADYIAATGRRPTLEFALIAGVNDTDAEIDALIDFCKGLHAHVNVIPINPVAGTSFTRSAVERVRAVAHRLQDASIEASVRTERGADIDAACGQLRQRAES